MVLNPRGLQLWVVFFSGFAIRGVCRLLPKWIDGWVGWGALGAQLVLVGLSFLALRRAKRQLRASKERLEQHLALFRGDA